VITQRSLAEDLISFLQSRPRIWKDIREIRCSLLTRVALLAASVPIVMSVGAPSVAASNDFDVTGTLDCGVRSGQTFVLEDWEEGPMLALFTEDISGTSERLVVDASWLRDHLTAFRQDDFVWFVVRDGIGPVPQVVSVVEHRCHDGRYPHGQVNHGLSTRDTCR
jgi:hypothetical protein